MKSTLFKWFVIWLGGMLFALLLYGFFGPKGKQIDLKEIDFTTTQSSELYFKNMRAYFYDREEEEKSGYLLYRIGSREDSSRLHFVILSNWRINEAYIMAESEQINLSETEAKIELIRETDTLRLVEKDATANYRFAAGVFESLDRDTPFRLEIMGKNYSFGEEEKKSLKQSLKDYFRLVGKLR